MYRRDLEEGVKGKGITLLEETPELLRAKNATHILNEVGSLQAASLPFSLPSTLNTDSTKNVAFPHVMSHKPNEN